MKSYYFIALLSLLCLLSACASNRGSDTYAANMSGGDNQMTVDQPDAATVAATTLRPVE